MGADGFGTFAPVVCPTYQTSVRSRGQGSWAFVPPGPGAECRRPGPAARGPRRSRGTASATRASSGWRQPGAYGGSGAPLCAPPPWAALAEIVRPLRWQTPGLAGGAPPTTARPCAPSFVPPGPGAECRHARPAVRRAGAPAPRGEAVPRGRSVTTWEERATRGERLAAHQQGHVARHADAPRLSAPAGRPSLSRGTKVIPCPVPLLAVPRRLRSRASRPRLPSTLPCRWRCTDGGLTASSRVCHTRAVLRCATVSAVACGPAGPWRSRTDSMVLGC